MENQNDEFYLERLKHNDQKALEVLFHKYFYSLCFFAKSFVKSNDLSEEIVSDVFLKIWENRKSLDIRQNLKAYLFVAIKNQTINYLNKNKMIFDQLEGIHQQSFRSEITAETSLTFSETQKEIEAIIEMLPQQRKIIFKLNRLEGFQYKEIAEILHISVNTVQKQMTEAVKYMSRYKSQFVTAGVLAFIFLPRFSGFNGFLTSF